MGFYLHIWETLQQAFTIPGATPSPEPLTVTLAENHKAMSTPDWAAIGVFTTIGLAVLGGGGAAVKAAFKYLNGMSVTLTSILSELKSLSQWVSKAEELFEAFRNDLHNLRVDVTAVRGTLTDHNHRIERLEEKDS